VKFIRHMFELVTVGDCTMDTFLIIDDATLNKSIDKSHPKLCLNFAEKICVEGTHNSIGGNASNVVVGAKKIGIDATIVSEIGDDFNGHIIVESLQERNIDTSYIHINKKRETRYSIVLNYKSERTILSSHANVPYTIHAFPKSQWLYYTSLGKSFEKIQKNIITYLKKNKDTKLAVNPGSYQITHGINTFKKILPYASICFVNKEEAEKFVGNQSSIKATISALHKLGPHMVVITDGTNGSYASNGVNTYHMPTYGIKAIAKTGAGDAYTSGFLCAIIKGKDIQTAMQYGTANASGVIQKFGAQQGLLTEKQLHIIIAHEKKIIPKKI